MAQLPNIPRLVIGGTASGVGKTTVAVGLVSALRQRGLRVATFKCGPDYLDPTYLSLASGGDCQNLDGWMMGRDAVVDTFTSAARDADLAVIEGVMGLFDGASPTSDEGSAAEIAKWLKAPVLLVMDAGGVARSAAAVAKGFSEFDADLPLAGLVCNRVGSRRHLELLREAVSTVPVVGGLPKTPGQAFQERHLGLHTAGSDTLNRIEAWGASVQEWFDLDAVVSLARGAPPLADTSETVASPVSPRCRLGIAFDDAFHFYYEDNLRRLRQLGAELVHFSPLSDERLPEVDGVYLGGGYPEVHAERLAANVSMRRDIAAFAEKGGPIYAECGGLMYLSTSIQTLDGKTHEMVGVIPGQSVVCDRLVALGYVEVETCGNSLLGGAGATFRGHQFRYSELRDVPSDIDRVYTIRRRRGGSPIAEGYRAGNVLGSYVHAHWASNPGVAEAFVSRCA